LESNALPTGIGDPRFQLVPELPCVFHFALLAIVVSEALMVCHGDVEQWHT